MRKKSAVYFFLTAFVLSLFINLTAVIPVAESDPIIPIPDPVIPLLLIPAAPTNLAVYGKTSTSISVSWTDNSNNEQGFKLIARKQGDIIALVHSVGANVTSYTFTGKEPETTYFCSLYAYNASGNSAYSNTVQTTTNASFQFEPLLPELIPLIPIDLPPAAPTELNVSAVSGTETTLSWEDNSTNETAFRIECKIEGGSYGSPTLTGEVGPNTTSITWSGLTAGTKYYYRVMAYNAIGQSSYSNEESVTTPTAALAQPIEIKLYIGSKDYSVNGVMKQMDVAPIIREGRTLLPARYIAEALGAQVFWLEGEQKVLITRGNSNIEMWVNKTEAKANGAEQNIDPNNANVTPIIIPPGRTMTPGRFIAENLGAQVSWDPVTQEVKITYQP
jgi:hypothetical protein